jgi:hypothetical protein
MSISKSSRINELRKQLETDVLRMQFFCLDPKWENFNEICNNRKLASEQGENLDTWRDAAITTYGKAWNEIYGVERTGLSPTVLDQARERYHKNIRTISSRLLLRPNRANLDKMWYFFFATGNIHFLQACFETAGNSRAAHDLALTAADMFDTFRTEYKNKIEEAIAGRHNFFKEQLELYGVEASGVFEEFQKKITEAEDKIKDMETQEGNSMQDLVAKITGAIKVKSDKGPEPLASEEVPAESSSDTDEQKAKEREASAALDNIIKGILPKLTKPT